MEVGDQKDGELVTNKSPKKQVRVYPRSSRSKLKNEGDPLEVAEEENPVKTKSKSRTTRSSRKAKTEDSADVVLGSEMNLESIEEEISTNNRTPVSQESAEIENSENTGSDGNRQQHQCGTCPRTFITIRGLRRHSSSCKGLLAKTPSSEAATSEASSSQNKRTALSAKADEVAAATAASIASESMDESMDTYLYDSHHSSDEYYDDDDDDMSSDYMSRSDGPSKKDIGDIIKEIKQFAQVEVEAVEEGLCHCCGEDLTTAHTSGEFKCEECKKHFKFKSSFDRHRRVVHNEGQTYECPECGTRCPDKGTLARHMYTHTGLKPHSCKVCHKTFSRRYHLVRHNMQTGCDGTEKPTFPCQVCGRVFNRKDNLREHLRAHAGQTKRKKSYMCELCGKEFFGTTLLHIHKRTHTGWERPYSCDLCEKKFPSTGAMKKHRRKHTGERPYECKECKARFAAKETLNRHIRTHNGLKPHSCQFCGKRFIQATQLRAHIFHHSGEHGFKCHHCGKSFNRRTRLSLHIKYVHEGAKPFTCNQCDKTFVRKEDLARHKILHTGVKAHKCPICEKDFAMKSSLKIHLLTHTKEPPRSCDECGRAFIRQDCLLRHMRTKHREMLEEIMVEAEKKKLQQQLISAADSDYFDQDPDEPAQVLSQEALAQSITELLSLLVDETTLKAFGWPDESVDHVLESVIRRCGHEPADYADMPYSDKLRENARLLFTVVIDDSVVKTLLNNQTVDEVILHVLRLAKS